MSDATEILGVGQQAPVPLEGAEPAESETRRIGPFEVGPSICAGPGAHIYEATDADGARRLLQVVRLGATSDATSLEARHEEERRIARRTAELLSQPGVIVHAHGGADGADGSRLLFWALPFDTARPILKDRSFREVSQVLQLARSVATHLADHHARGQVEPLLSEHHLAMDEGGAPRILGVPVDISDAWLAAEFPGPRRAPEEAGAKPTKSGDVWRLGRLLRAVCTRVTLPAEVERFIESLVRPEPERRPATAADVLNDLDGMLAADPDLMGVGEVVDAGLFPAEEVTQSAAPLSEVLSTGGTDPLAVTTWGAPVWTEVEANALPMEPGLLPGVVDPDAPTRAETAEAPEALRSSLANWQTDPSALATRAPEQVTDEAQLQAVQATSTEVAADAAQVLPEIEGPTTQAVAQGLTPPEAEVVVTDPESSAPTLSDGDAEAADGPAAASEPAEPEAEPEADDERPSPDAEVVAKAPAASEPAESSESHAAAVDSADADGDAPETLGAKAQPEGDDEPLAEPEATEPEAPQTSSEGKGEPATPADADEPNPSTEGDAPEAGDAPESGDEAETIDDSSGPSAESDDSEIEASASDASASPDEGTDDAPGAVTLSDAAEPTSQAPSDTPPPDTSEAPSQDALPHADDDEASLPEVQATLLATDAPEAEGPAPKSRPTLKEGPATEAAPALTEAVASADVHKDEAQVPAADGATTLTDSDPAPSAVAVRSTTGGQNSGGDPDEDEAAMKAIAAGWDQPVLPSGESPWSEVVSPQGAHRRDNRGFSGFEAELPDEAPRAPAPVAKTSSPPAPAVFEEEDDSEAFVAAISAFDPRKVAGGVLAVLVILGLFAMISRTGTDPDLNPVDVVPPGNDFVLESKPVGAEVVSAADGRVLGKTPLSFLVPPASSARLFLVADGYEPLALELLERGGIEARLQPRTKQACTVDVNVPSGATIETVSGEAVAPGPVQVRGARLVRARAGQAWTGARLIRCPDRGGPPKANIKLSAPRHATAVRITEPAGSAAYLNGEPVGRVPTTANTDRGFIDVRVDDASGMSEARWVPVRGPVEIRMPTPKPRRRPMLVVPDTRAGDADVRALVQSTTKPVKLSRSSRRRLARLRAAGGRHLKAGRTRRASRSYRECLRIDPGDPRCHRGLGDLYRKIGKTDKAQVYYSRYLELSPQAADADLIRGYLEQ